MSKVRDRMRKGLVLVSKFLPYSFFCFSFTMKLRVPKPVDQVTDKETQ